MTLEEAMETTVSAEEARAEIQRHSSDGGWEQFTAEHGIHETYPGSTVLGWLGY